MIDYTIKNLEDGIELTINEQWLCDKINSVFKTNIAKGKSIQLLDNSIYDYLESHISIWSLTKQTIL